MDSACYDSVNNKIIAVRGGRVYKCNAVTGAVEAQSDYQNNQQLGLGAASIVFDTTVVGGACYVTCWNTGNFDTPSAGGVRTIYRISATTLATNYTADFAATFGTGLAAADYEGGIAAMKKVGSVVYAVGWNSTLSPTWSVFKFTPASGGITFPAFRQIGISGPTPCFGVNSDVIYWASQNGRDMESWDFTGSAFNSSAAGLLGYVATEYAPPSNSLYVTRQFQFIDIYDLALNNTGTINTLRTAFNGVNIRYNSNDSLLYIAGGGDNVVYTLNPATNTLSLPKTGFDLPWDFVFTPTKKFAVQQGSVGLKEIV